MKKAFLLLFAGMVVLSACMSNNSTTTPSCTDQDPSKEDASMVAYATTAGLTVTKDTTYDYYYQILNAGSGSTTPSDYTYISFTYTGKLLNGTIFDSSTTPVTNQLGALIKGFRLAIPKIKKDGHIKLVLPSYLGYGCNGAKNNSGVTVIPANSPIFFDVTITNVQ